MGISLSKGNNISLTKQAPDLSAVTVGLGWDTRTTSGADVDLDSSAIVCGANSQALSGAHFVFFNNKSSPGGDVTHSGDNLTGAGEGDDEQLKVALGTLGTLGTVAVVAARTGTVVVHRDRDFDVLAQSLPDLRVHSL